MASNPSRVPIVMGYPAFGPGATTTQLNAAATWLAFGFIPRISKTINKVRVFVSAVAGTLAATDLTCDVYSDTPGQPNASLGSTSNIGGTAPTGAGWIEFQGLSVALTSGTQYWLVFKNVNAVPGTNNATYRYVTSGIDLVFAAKATSLKAAGACVDTTTNSGSAWTAANNLVAGFRIGYSDSSYEGLAISNVAAGTDNIFGSNEVGVKFTSPANAILNVQGIAFTAESVGTPTGNLRFRLYNNTTLLATTDNLVCSIPTATLGDWCASYFSSDQVIQPGTTLRATMSDSAADSSSNCFKSGNEVTVDTDANSLALLPFQGTLQKTTFNGTTWTDTNSSIMPFALILDSAGEFASSGGMIQSRVFTGF